MLVSQRSIGLVWFLSYCFGLSRYSVRGQVVHEDAPITTEQQRLPWGPHWKKLPRKGPSFYYNYHGGKMSQKKSKSTKQKLYGQAKGKSSSYKAKGNSSKGHWNGKWQGKWKGEGKDKDVYKESSPFKKWNGPSLLGTRYKTVVADFTSLGTGGGQSSSSSPSTLFYVEMRGMPVQVDVRLPPVTTSTTKTSTSITTPMSGSNAAQAKTFKVVTTTSAVALNGPCPTRHVRTRRTDFNS